MTVRVWREVGAAELRSGRGSLLGPATARRTRWWELTLKPCGHKIERHARYRRLDPPARQGTRRGAADVLPAPARACCPVCTASLLENILAERGLA